MPNLYQPDLRARIDAEEVLQEIAEITLAQRSAKPVRDAECALESRQPERRRHRDDGEVRLQRHQIQIRIVRWSLSGLSRGSILRRRLSRPVRDHGQYQQKQHYASVNHHLLLIV